MLRHYTCKILETESEAFELLLKRVVQDSYDVYGRVSRNETTGEYAYPDTYEYEIWLTDEEVSAVEEAFNAAPGMAERKKLQMKEATV